MDLKSLQEDMKNAMKAGESAKLGVIRMLISEIKKKEIDTRTTLDEAAIQKTISTMIKQRNDSIEAFDKGDRKDLADKERAELAFLQAYQPTQLTREEMEKMVTEIIAETGAAGPADIGKVMKAATAKAAGRADGKVVNEIARAKLSGK